MKFFRIILTAIAIIVGLYLIVSIFMPAEYRISRNILINAAPNFVFNNVADFKNWEKWNPWSDFDKNIKYSFSGEHGQTGSSLAWTSNNAEVGNITRVIDAIEKNNFITNSLIIENRKNGSETFRVSSENDMTKLTWNINIPLGFFFRILGPLMDLKIGSIMEKGLSNITKLYQTDGKVNLIISQETLQNQMYIVKRGNAPHNDPVAISTALRNAYSEVVNFASYFNLIITGQPIALNIEWGDNYVFDAGLPVAEVRVPQSTGAVKFINIMGGKVVKGVYTGQYENIAPAYNLLEKYIASNNLKIDGYSWEEYISDPKYTQRDSLITNIYFPVK